MARTSVPQRPPAPPPRRTDGIETLNGANPLDPSNIPEADLSNYDGQVVGSAVTAEDLDRPSKPFKRFTVLKGGIVQTQINGPRARLLAGKVIDELNYDISLLKRQGVELVEEAS